MGIKRKRAMIYKHRNLNVYIYKKGGDNIKLMPNGIVVADTAESLKDFYPAKREGYIEMLDYVKFRAMSIAKSNRLVSFITNFDNGSVSYFEAGELPMSFTSFSGTTVLQLDCQSDISSIEKQHIHDENMKYLVGVQFETFFNNLK